MDAVKEAEVEPPVGIRDRSRSRNSEPIIVEPKKEKEKTRGGEYIGQRKPIKKAIDKRRALKPNDTEEFKKFWTSTEKQDGNKLEAFCKI